VTFFETQCSYCQQGHVGSKTFLQQCFPVLNWRWGLTRVDQYNEQKWFLLLIVTESKHWCIWNMTLWDWNVYIIRPHHSTTYIDAAYCYQPSCVVCRSVCMSVTLVSAAKMAEPTEMPFGLRTQVGPGNHVLDGGPDAPHGNGGHLDLHLIQKGASHCRV